MIRRQQSLDDFMSDLLNGSGQASPTIVTDNARAPSGSVTPPSPLVCYLDHLKFHDDRIGITFPSTSARQSKSRWDAESSPRSIRQTKVGLILPLRRQESRERVQQEKEREKPAVSHSYKSIPLMGDVSPLDCIGDDKEFELCWNFPLTSVILPESGHDV